MSLTGSQKNDLSRAFLHGQSVTDLSAYLGVTRSTVEDVLREALTGLAQLNERLDAERRAVKPVYEPLVLASTVGGETA